MPVGVVMAATFLTGVCLSGGQKSAIALAAVQYSPAVRWTRTGWALGVGTSAVSLALGAGWTPEDVFYATGMPMLVAAFAIYVIALNRPRNDATPMPACQQPAGGLAWDSGLA
jgi:MFS transporter, AAHS family, 4-hydroxybenzoate transporter